MKTRCEKDIFIQKSVITVSHLLFPLSSLFELVHNPAAHQVDLDFSHSLSESGHQLEIGFFIELVLSNLDPDLPLDCLKDLNFVGGDEADGLSLKSIPSSSSNSMDIVGDSAREVIVDHQVNL